MQAYVFGTWKSLAIICFLFFVFFLFLFFFIIQGDILSYVWVHTPNLTTIVYTRPRLSVHSKTNRHLARKKSNHYKCMLTSYWVCSLHSLDTVVSSMQSAVQWASVDLSYKTCWNVPARFLQCLRSEGRRLETRSSSFLSFLPFFISFFFFMGW